MNVRKAAKSFYEKLLASLEETLEPQPDTVPALLGPAAPQPPSEFESFLSELGADATESRRAGDSILKDSTIAELTLRLQDLQTLGERLATTEIERLRGLERISELETLLSAHNNDDVERLEKKVASLDRARNRESEKLARMRTKFEDRKRVAADRWRELLELRRELKQLKSTGRRDAA